MDDSWAKHLAVKRPEPNVFIEFEVGEALPSSKRLSSWISAVALICNDSIQDALSILRSENERHELLYFTRIAAGHLYEAAKFMASTPAAWPEVQALLGKLDPNHRADWELVVALWRHPSTPFRRAVENARQYVFHYPEVHVPRRQQKVAAALERMSDETGRIELGKKLASYRFEFADALALDMVIEPLAGHEQQQFEEFAMGLLDHVQALQRCSEAVLAHYFYSLGAFIEAPPPEA